MIEDNDDHLPPPPSAVAVPAARPERAASPASHAASAAWGDRLLFAIVGLLLGFTAAYMYLQKAAAPAPAAAVDPHAGLPGFSPGATRDMPGSGGGAPPISMDPAIRERMQELEQLVSQSPDSYDLLVQLGNAAYDADDSRKAVDAYERAVKIRGTDPNVLTDLGTSYRNLGDGDRALEYFQKALKIDPKHAAARFNQVIVYGLDRGDVAKAKEILAELKRDNPQMPALDRLAVTLDQRGQ